MRVAVVLLTLAACEHAGPKPAPDPIQQAHDELELLPAAAAAGTSELYTRDDFLPAGARHATEYDVGDFIGRLRTLFGARDGDLYVLRDKKTGVVITARSDVNDGSSYGGTPEPGQDARVAADPILQRGEPTGPAIFVYTRHRHDALAGPKNAEAIARLDALVSRVAPADFSEITFQDEEPTVWRIGAKAGHSFQIEVPASEGMAFLLARARPAAYEPDIDVIEYYLEHQFDLPDDAKSKALAGLSHVAMLAKQVGDADQRALLAEQIADYTEQLR